MDDDALIRAICETVAGFLELGNETFDAEGARFVRNRATPRRYDANHVGRIRCEPAHIDALLARADPEYAGYDYRRFDTDPLTPPALVARLVLEGYVPAPEIHLLLEGELRTHPQPCDIRPIDGDAAWDAYARLEALDWQESTARQGRPFEPDILGESTASKRAKAPDVRYWLAYAEGVPVAYCCSWPDADGVGMVEDLFTRADYRHRGIATALIARCVDDARARGAGPVVIGADPTDTPMRMYAALGFRPLVVTTQYFKRMPGSPVIRDQRPVTSDG